jgi:hypothetical protein
MSNSLIYYYLPSIDDDMVPIVVDLSQVKPVNQQITSMLILESIKATFASSPYSISNTYWLFSIRRNRRMKAMKKMICCLYGKRQRRYSSRTQLKR